MQRIISGIILLLACQLCNARINANLTLMNETDVPLTLNLLEMNMGNIEGLDEGRLSAEETRTFPIRSNDNFSSLFLSFFEVNSTDAAGETHPVCRILVNAADTFMNIGTDTNSAELNYLVYRLRKGVTCHLDTDNLAENRMTIHINRAQPKTIKSHLMVTNQLTNEELSLKPIEMQGVEISEAPQARIKPNGSEKIVVQEGDVAAYSRDLNDKPFVAYLIYGHMKNRDDAALCAVGFNLPNQFDLYHHDTHVRSDDYFAESFDNHYSCTLKMDGDGYRLDVHERQLPKSYEELQSQQQSHIRFSGLLRNLRQKIRMMKQRQA